MSHELPMVAALFVATGGAYFDLPNVDPWPLERDARTYAGPWPVVAHPPCSRWCQLAYINQKRYGQRVGNDGGCFASALASVRRWGGVLEHPARTYAWPAFGLPTPTPGAAWTRVIGDPGWVCEVSQRAYGHPARKLTWLYYVGETAPVLLDPRKPAAVAQVSFCANHGDSPLPRLSKRAAAATPPTFRDVLVELARGSRLVTAKPTRGEP